MIIFLMTPGHLYTMEKVLADGAAPPVTVRTYDWLFRQRQLPSATYIFGDIDRLGHWDRELAALVWRELKAAGCKVLNDPARVRTRFAMLRALYEAGINRFNAYRAEECVTPERFPVFLRRDSGHGQPLSDLLHTRDDVKRAVEAAEAKGTPEAAIIIIEYCAETVAPGLFRKTGVYRLGDATVPHVNVHDTRWLVKYGRHGIATPDLYEEEFRFARDNPFADRVMQAFEVARIDYGRADFGLVGGVPQLFEINTNPDCRPGNLDHPVPRRLESQALSWSKYLHALSALDTAPGGATIGITHAVLRKYQNEAVKSRRHP